MFCRASDFSGRPMPAKGFVMSLLEQVRQAAAKKNANARQQYVTALRGGKPDPIAKAVADAGISEQQLAGDIQLLQDAKRLTVATADISDLRVAKAAAEKASLAAGEEYRRVAGDLRAEFERLRLDFDAVDAQLKGTEAELGRLVQLYKDSDLLDLTVAPEIVKERLALNARHDAKTKEIHDAMTVVVRLREELKTAEGRLLSVRQQRAIGGWHNLADDDPEVEPALRIRNEAKSALDAALARFEALRNGSNPSDAVAK